MTEPTSAREQGTPSSRGPDVGGPESVRKGTRLVLLANHAMRARRRPRAILVLYAYQTILALLVAWPVASAVGATYGSHPRGDAVLFDPGGYNLLAFVRASQSAITPLFTLALVVVAFGALLGLVPLIALITSIAHTTPDVRAPRARHVAPYVMATFAPMTILLVAAGALELAVLVVGLVAFGAVRQSLATSAGEAHADQIAAVVLVLFLLALAAVGVVHDLARAALVRFRASVLQALRAALVTYLKRPWRLLWSWGWRSGSGWLAVTLVALLAARLGASTAALVALVCLHQLVAAARVGLRASWLAEALRSVDEVPNPPRSSRLL